VKIFAAILVLATAGLTALHGTESTKFAAAERLIEQGLPTMALAKLHGMDTTAWQKEVKNQHTLLRGRAFLAAARPEEAVNALQSIAETPEGAFWLAESYAIMGRHSMAASAYATAEDGGAELANRARIGRARMLAHRGDRGAAEEILRATNLPEARMELAALTIDSGRPLDALEILDSTSVESARRSELLARAKEALGEPEEAYELLVDIPPADRTTERRLTMLQARLALKLNRPEIASSTLETWISSDPHNPQSECFFHLLELAQKSVSAPDLAPLRRWVGDSRNPARANRAALAMARIELAQGNVDAARDLYRKFLEEAGPSDPLLPKAKEELATLLVEAGDPGSALAIVAEGRGPGLDFARGLASAAAGDHASASKFFDAAWQAAHWDSARHNALLSLALTDKPLTGAPPWTLEARAMAAAAREYPRAEELLTQLVASGNASSGSALALAELQVVNGNHAAALPALRQISNPDPATAERAAALAVFAEDTGLPDSSPRAIAAAESFLRNFPDSELSPMVEMKLGEILFRRGDYLSAREHFTAVAESPTAELAQQARFMAARSAANSLDQAGREEAIELYEDVARTGGTLAPRARLSQALLLNTLGRPEEAIALIDSLLDTDPGSDIRFAALIEKGDALFSMGDTNPEFYRRAIATWRLAVDAPPRWRNQALVKIGTASENLGETEAALSSFVDAMEPPSGDDAPRDPEYFWSYKAGFDAASLLESLNRPTEAAALYARLAARQGPRAEEARQRLSRLQLENFLWDQQYPVQETKEEKP
jgi:tetratricopeptide (TPR) repeat protein